MVLAGDTSLLSSITDTEVTSNKLVLNVVQQDQLVSSLSQQLDSTDDHLKPETDALVFALSQFELVFEKGQCKFLYPKGQSAVDTIIGVIIQKMKKWKKLFPNLFIFWILPPIVDFTKVNTKRALDIEKSTCESVRRVIEEISPVSAKSIKKLISSLKEKLDLIPTNIFEWCEVEGEETDGFNPSDESTKLLWNAVIDSLLSLECTETATEGKL